MRSPILILLLCFISLLWPPSIAGDRDDGRKAHVQIFNPAQLGPDRAEAIYESIRESMARHYGESLDPLARTYQRWDRINQFPYPSATHGDMFVNNYANSAATRQYAARDRSGPYPTGSIIAKDGFIVTKEGNILTGPLNIIEKVPPGDASPNAEGWRFIEIRPNGTRFCAACHIQRNGAIAPFFFVPLGNESKGQ